MLRRMSGTLMLMLFSPAYALWEGLKSKSAEYKRWVIVIFLTVVGSIYEFGKGSDGLGFRQAAREHYLGLPIEQFLQEAWSILILKPAPGVKGDLYIHVLSYLVGGILHMPGLLFTIAAFIYAYFYSGSMMKVFSYRRLAPKSKLLIYFSVLFVLWKSIEGINAVRTWTGMWVLFYAAFSYYETGKKKYLWLALTPPLIHVGFYAMVIPALFVLFTGTRSRIYSVIFFLSFILNTGDRVIKFIPENDFAQQKVTGYYKEDPHKVINSDYYDSQIIWHKKAQQMGIHKLAANILAALLILNGAFARHMNRIEKNLFAIGILTMSFSNVTGSVGELQGRSSYIAIAFILAVTVLLFRRNYFNQYYNSLNKVLLPIVALIFFPILLISLSYISIYTSVFVFAFPFLGWFISHENRPSIRELVFIVFGR